MGPMKTLSVILSLMITQEHISENDAQNDWVVVGEAAERMIINGTVVQNYSTEVQYGVKHYYVVLYGGYQWLCEQATYRISCHVEVEEPL